MLFYVSMHPVWQHSKKTFSIVQALPMDTIRFVSVDMDQNTMKPPTPAQTQSVQQMLQQCQHIRSAIAVSWKEIMRTVSC